MTPGMAGREINLTAPSYKTFQVLNVIEVSARQLQWWDEQNIVRPVKGRHARHYHLDDLVSLSVVTSLREKGVGLSRIRLILRAFRAFAGRTGGYQFYVVWDGKRTSFARTPDDVAEIASRSRRAVTVVNLHATVQEIQKRLLTEKKNSVTTQNRSE